MRNRKEIEEEFSRYNSQSSVRDDLPLRNSLDTMMGVILDIRDLLQEITKEKK